MSIYKVLINLDALFANSRVTPVIINDLPNVSEEQRLRNKERIYQEYRNDVYNTTPSCDCGALRKEYLIGVMCDKCNTPVQSVLERDLEPQLWMRPPRGVSKFISPMVWILLSDFFMDNKFDMLFWIANTDYHPKKIPETVQQAEQAGIKRGYNYLVENFDHVLNTLLSLPRYSRKDQREKRENLLKVLNMYKGCIFSNHFPLLNKNMMILENNSTARYVDDTIPLAVDAMQFLLGIDTSAGERNQRSCENRTAKMIAGMSAFFLAYFKENVASKPGLARKHLFSTRVNWSARSVITSLTEPHHYDELHAPWGVGIGMMRIHLMNRLTALGLRPNQVFGLLSAAAQRYHPLIDKIFKDLINESPEKGLVGTFTRNPSLSRASMQRMRVTRFKTNPQDPTIGLSILSVTGFNAPQGSAI